jgi:outer membrane protein TolC
MNRFLFLLIIGFTFGQLVKAQENTNPLNAIDYNKLQIPPLEVLFENARKSPAVEFYQARMEEEASLLKTEKRSWLKYFKVGSSWQYGRVGVNSAFSDEYTPLFYQYSSATQNNYYVTAGVSIPLDDLFDRSNRIKRQALKTKSTRIEIEKWHDEQKIRIIEMYTEIMKQLAILKIKTEALTFANAQFEASANDFKNGNTKIGELNSAKAIQANASESYENVRSQLNSALLQLEILSKTKIISK